MATFTTRLGLRKPATTDQVNVSTDLDAVYDAIDAAVGSTVATSTTRPSSPWDGEQLFETDTHNELVYHGGWYHESIPVVSSTGSILNPYTGQVIYDTSINQLRTYSGTAWLTASAYARYYISANQSTGSGDNVVPFANADTTDPRVTVTSNSFSLAAGTWTIDASVRVNTAMDCGLYLVTGTTATEANAFCWGTEVSSNVLAGVCATKQFTSTTTVSVVLWNASANTIIPYGANGSHVTFLRHP